MNKTAQARHGQPEDQLRAPFETLLKEISDAMGKPVVCTGESTLPQGLGSPDYAVHVGGLLVGYVELKAPGKGADARRFKGHDRSQFKRFSALPNLLYTDGNEWALYRSGERVGDLVRLPGNVAKDGRRAADSSSAKTVEALLNNFLAWEPLPPQDRSGNFDLRTFSEQLAPLCRMLRDDVAAALRDPKSELKALQQDWRKLLFPEASDAQFADAYAQTVTFALLLGRSEGANPLTLGSAEERLAAEHTLLARALRVLTDTLIEPDSRRALTASLDFLLRVTSVVPPGSLMRNGDPWLHFYEDFLAAYDPALRKDAGVYYTPVEVVRCQVRLADELLRKQLRQPLGFASPSVVTLDPAVGTGTYLLGVISHALERVSREQGLGAVGTHATSLASNLYGFEIMTGPFAVAELRVNRALRDSGARLKRGTGPQIYLSDTLESPHAEPIQLPLFLRPISDQRSKALDVKSKTPVLVCLGNPPYDRHEAASVDNRARTGGWVRWGDEREPAPPILDDFTESARTLGGGVHLKNLYNLYVYFWRWALWKVFESNGSSGPGIVSFISASSYLDGSAFSGMREHMRRVCDEIWILDLGGEGHAEPRDDNVFAIKTPVAIAIAARTRAPGPERPARVRYARISGARERKLATLDAVMSFSALKWQDCADEWQASFRPSTTAASTLQAKYPPTGPETYSGWPLLTELMPWQHSGVQLKRTWPISSDVETLERRWKALLASDNRAAAFHETEDRRVASRYGVLIGSWPDSTPIAKLPPDGPPPEVVRYGYRSFDRQYILADGRLMSRPRPALWNVRSGLQIFFTGLLTKRLAPGPALTATIAIPDLDHFSNRGGKDVIALHRTSSDSDPNIAPGLLDAIGDCLGRFVCSEDFAAYIYGVLACPAFTARFSEQLQPRNLRVPLTKDPALFESAAALGRRLLWLHSYGQRFVPNSEPFGRIPPGSAKCVGTIPADEASYPRMFQHDAATGVLRVGIGRFAPVSRKVFEFTVSGFSVVRSWLKYRMKEGGGKKSSPLDQIRALRWTGQMTTEFLELLWVLETTLEIYPEQSELLERIVAGECFLRGELPQVPARMRVPPQGTTKAFMGLPFENR